MTHQQPEESFDQVVARLRARGLVTDRTSMPMTPTTSTSDGSSERDRMLAIVQRAGSRRGHGLVVGQDECIVDDLIAAGFTRAHGETVALSEARCLLQAQAKIRDLTAERDDARAFLACEVAGHKGTLARAEAAEAKLAETLREVPCGYLPLHKIENLPAMVRDLAQSQAGYANDLDAAPVVTEDLICRAASALRLVAGEADWKVDAKLAKRMAAAALAAAQGTT